MRLGDKKWFFVGMLIIICFLQQRVLAADSAEKSSLKVVGMYNVMDFGAVGDGIIDDTKAFQTALDTVAVQGGGVVMVPWKSFLIAGHLSIPDNVTLEGLWRAPNRWEGVGKSGGSILLATEGKGNPNGIPFISLNTNSMLKGLTIYYPQQIVSETPHPYPWTVRGSGDNCTIRDVLMVNPYQAVDFGTYPSGRHFIDGLYAHALYRGIFVDKCFDVGRISNIHFWPFWVGSSALDKFTKENLVAFTFGRSDWEMVSDSFVIFAKVGFLFKAFENGSGNYMISQSGADIGPCAVRVEEVQGHSGVTFSNCQMMAAVEVLPTNKGPVKFTSTGFWPISSTKFQAKLRGQGHVSFANCHFADWDMGNKGDFCIDADCAGLSITGSYFMKPKNHIRLGPDVKMAVITSNRFEGIKTIKNQAEQADIQIGFNVNAIEGK